MSPLAIFTGPYALLAKWGVIAALLAAFGGWAWFKGNEHGTQKLIDFKAAQAVEAVRLKEFRQVVTEKVVTKFIQVAAKTKVVTNTVHDEVIRYVETNPGYCLDARWGELHDAAADNTLPGAPGRTDGPSRAPTAAGALEAVTENYGACHRTADRLDALQEWVSEQRAVK